MIRATLSVFFFRLLLSEPINLSYAAATKIELSVTTKLKGKHSVLECNHNLDRESEQIYTVLEGEELNLKFSTDYSISRLLCINKFNDKQEFCPRDNNIGTNKLATFKAISSMGTFWNCTVMSLPERKKNGVPAEARIFPEIEVNGYNYNVAYCYMRIHVRRIESPQTILVNNVELETVQADLSEKDVDRFGVYYFEDGDIIRFSCNNFKDKPQLNIEFSDEFLDNDSLNRSISSHLEFIFQTKLRSGHNNSYIICNNKETDYNKIKITFVLRTQLDPIHLQINGLTVRPKPLGNAEIYHKIEYRYTAENIELTCEISEPDLKLFVPENNIKKFSKIYAIQDKKAEISFPFNDTGIVSCRVVEEPNNRNVETVEINFSKANQPSDLYALHMDMPTSGIVLDYYTTLENKVIYYEYEDEENLTLSCSLLHNLTGKVEPDVCLQFDDSNTNENKTVVNVTETLQLTAAHDNMKKICYLKKEESEGVRENKTKNSDGVIREIAVILRMKQLRSNSDSYRNSSGNTISDEVWMIIIGSIMFIVIIIVIVFIIKRRQRNTQIEPINRNPTVFVMPSHLTIPAFPHQLEPAQYAVPVDFKQDEVTYAEPHVDKKDLYSTAIPKNLRNNINDLHYASLDLKTSTKAIYNKRTDADYAEIHGSPGYVEVLTGAERSAHQQGYVNVNDANIEPTYCEPNNDRNKKVPYANTNKAPYENCPDLDYVEPTYCELSKLN